MKKMITWFLALLLSFLWACPGVAEMEAPEEEDVVFSDEADAPEEDENDVIFADEDDPEEGTAGEEDADDPEAEEEPAEAEPTEAPKEEKKLNERDYLGTMKVVNCKEWVSLREKASQNTERLAKVPLGELVYDCYRDEKGFVYCQYQGTYGYVLRKYLEPVAGALKPGETVGESRIMSMEEILGEGEEILNWVEYNLQVVAAMETITENDKETDVLRVGCFLDEDALWGFETKAEKMNGLTVVRAYIGGTETEPQVLVYNGVYGLTMLELLSGRILWTLSAGVKNLGDAAAFACNTSDGTLYIAGTEGPDLTAISPQGTVLWESEVKDKTVYGPYEVVLDRNAIQVKYHSGLASGYKLVTLDYTGNLVRMTEITE